MEAERKNEVCSDKELPDIVMELLKTYIEVNLRRSTCLKLHVLRRAIGKISINLFCSSFLCNSGFGYGDQHTNEYNGPCYKCKIDKIFWYIHNERKLQCL